ncbi:MAG: 3'-5' exonuclease [Sulfurovaceae bacterium]|nr:3'-5' exonuclease [Sulfurovaceae bacterium]
MKIAYIDTETTGLNPKKHGIIQLACLIVEDHKIIDQIDLLIDPFSYKEDCQCDDKALEINGRCIEEIGGFPNSDSQLENFCNFLSGHIEDGTLQIAGYNIEFDIGFIKEWFDSCDVPFKDFFNYKNLDILSLVRHIEYFAADVFELENHKLSTVCERLDIELDAHNAMNDIIATFYAHEKIRVLMAFGFDIEDGHMFEGNGCKVCGKWVQGDLCRECAGEHNDK